MKYFTISSMPYLHVYMDKNVEKLIIYSHCQCVHALYIIINWPETEQGSFMAAQTPIQDAYSANLTVQVDSDLCKCYVEGYTSKFSQFNFTDMCHYTLYSHAYNYRGTTRTWAYMA